MIYNIFRFFALMLLLVFVLVKDIKIPVWIKNQYIQLYIAIFIILFLIFIDDITGFIFGIAILVLYFRIYNKELKNKKNQSKENNIRCVFDNTSKPNMEDFVENKPHKTPCMTEIEYVTEEHLLAAQNNIIDVNNYNKEILGIENDKVYGTQNLEIKGVDFSVLTLGSLAYSVID